MRGKPSDEALLTIRDVAAKAGVCERTVRRWIDSGLLPARRLGGTGRIVRVGETDWIAFAARS